MSVATDTRSGQIRPSGRNGRAVDSWACHECDFTLWIPLARLEACDVGLYDDARFPGRLIVTLRHHYEHLDEVPEATTCAPMRDIRTCSTLLRRDLAGRVNVAILGNQVAHVHAHVIPRLGSAERLPREAPWRDPRPRSDLATHRRDELIDQLSEGLHALFSSRLEAST
ncbi:MAG: HIT family protein [Actinomycetales bacterium]